MENSKFVGVRFDKQLFNKLNKHPLNNSDIIRKAVKQYFRTGEPNSRVEDFVKQGFTNEYNVELVDLLKDQVSDLKKRCDRLESKNDYLSLGFLGRKIFLLKSHS